MINLLIADISFLDCTPPFVIGVTTNDKDDDDEVEGAEHPSRGRFNLT